jgi:hypothetical protein
MTPEEKLDREIRSAAKRERRYGWANYIAAYSVAVVALIGSIAASILAALQANKLFTAVVAAIPAAVLAITRIFDFEQRAFYHWRKVRRFRGLSRRLNYEGDNAKNVSQDFTDVDLKSLDEWIPFDVDDMEKRARERVPRPGTTSGIG